MDDQPSQPPKPAPPQPEPSAEQPIQQPISSAINPNTQKRRSKPFWIILIVVGSLLVLSFLGAIAAEVAKRLIEATPSVRNSASTAIDIQDTPVELVGSTLNSDCFTHTVPTDYILSPNATSCQVEIRLSAGLATGASLTAITIMAQTGDDTVSTFLQKVTKSAEDSGLEVYESKTTTVNGYEAGIVIFDDSLGVRKSIYFIPAEPNKFISGDTAITSYMISGPSYNQDLRANLAIVTESFKLK